MSRHVAFVCAFLVGVVCLVSECSPMDENESSLDSKQLMGDWSLLNQADKKNSWRNFQGSWGKRREPPTEFQDEANNEEDDFEKRNNWSRLHGAWGKRSSEAGLFVNNSPLLQDLLFSSEGDQEALPLKRNWEKFAGSWGKRPYTSRSVVPRSTNWSTLRGSWGKRSGDWAQLRGVWGKRSEA